MPRHYSGYAKTAIKDMRLSLTQLRKQEQHHTSVSTEISRGYALPRTAALSESDGSTFPDGTDEALQVLTLQKFYKIGQTALSFMCKWKISSYSFCQFLFGH